MLAFGSISRQLEKSVITLPMAYVTYGLLISSATLGLIEAQITNKVIRVLAEVTLAMVDFAVHFYLKII